MKIRSRNAFQTNRLGQAPKLFPFSLKVSQIGNVIRTFVCAQRVVDVCDLIERHSSDHLVLFGVEGFWFRQLTKKVLSLEAAARDAKVQFSAIDSETLILPKKELSPLLLTFDHYNLSLFDIDNNFNEIRVISHVLTHREHDWQKEKAVLPELPGSKLLVDSHDDCYLTTESYNPDVSKDIFIRALQIYADTILAQRNKSTPEIADMPHGLLDAFWEQDFGLTILEEGTEIEDDYLEIGVAKQPFTFRDETEYTLDFWLMYEIQTQNWVVHM